MSETTKRQWVVRYCSTVRCVAIDSGYRRQQSNIRANRTAAKKISKIIVWLTAVDNSRSVAECNQETCPKTGILNWSASLPASRFAVCFDQRLGRRLALQKNQPRSATNFRTPLF